MQEFFFSFSFFPLEIGSPTFQDGLELVLCELELLEPSHPVLQGAGFEPKISCMLGRDSTKLILALGAVS